MNLFKRTLTFICAISLVIALLFSIISQVIFGNIDYYRHEFEKYNVTKNIDMTMDDIMLVMDELMDYLHNDRADLEDIKTTVNGNKVTFFTEREKMHMADCKILFDKGFDIRNMALGIFSATIIILLFINRFDIQLFFKDCGLFSICILCICIIIAIAAAINFDVCFEIFHKIFFNNNLWIFDPKKDLIINILVEDLFSDLALKIGLLCIAALVGFIAVRMYISVKNKKRDA